MISIVEISGHKYQVRVQDGERQIMVNSKWMPADKFIEHLVENGQYDQIFDLAKYGKGKLDEEIKSLKK